MLKQPGLAACDEAHLKGMEPHHRRCYRPAAPLLGRPVSSPVHARWCPRGSRKGASSRRTAPVKRLTHRRTKPLNGSRRPRAPGPRWGARAATGLRPLPGPFLPEHCPSFTIRVARRGHQIPLFILDTLIPFGHFYFIISVE